MAGQFKLIAALFLLVSTALAAPVANDDQGIYNIGVGIADITGPAAEVNMMGYAKFGQDTAGIHTRLYARTFVIQDQNGNRVAYVSCDLGMIDQAVKTQVAATLREKYDGLYTTENVLLSGTHTHSGPGGFLQYLLYTIVSQGFTKLTFDAIVNGIVLSVDRAHKSSQLATMEWSQGVLLNASINRSPSAYLNNTAEERAKYQYNTDNDFYQLKFIDTNSQPIGILNWFAVHGTCMNNTNSLISGDNKGQAALMFENHINPDALPGKGPFVAGFASANLGDISPNTKGPRCIDTGLPCDGVTSTCNGKNENCIAFGPGKDMFESTQIIAERQYKMALELFGQTGTKITGPVGFVHQHLDMSNQTVTLADGTTAKTCKPAMGYSFAAGTTDGPGAFDFKQGTTSGNAFWNLVRDFIAKPSADLIACQAPKPILLATGQMNFPYQWQPTILPTQIIRVGQLVVVAVPSEFTTMAGRRMKEMVTQELAAAGIKNAMVVLSGLSNAYSSYVTTFEEYQIQRYEGASTIFGPHTLEAYMQQYRSLIQNLAKNVKPAAGPDPPNLLSKQISLRPGVVYDGAPFGKSFGDVTRQPDDFYSVNETVVAKFVAGHPQNNLKQEDSFLTVERLDDKSGKWIVIALDGNLETKFQWKRTNSLLGQSEATVLWDIPQSTKPGLYRITHSGAYKTVFQQIKQYKGTTNSFKVADKKF